MGMVPWLNLLEETSGNHLDSMKVNSGHRVEAGPSKAPVNWRRPTGNVELGVKRATYFAPHQNRNMLTVRGC